MAGATHRVVAVTHAHQSLFELAVVTEVFGVDRRDLTERWYDFAICAAEAVTHDLGTGARLAVHHGLERIETAQTVIVAGGAPACGPPDPRVVDAVRRAHSRGARVVSICGGAFVLATAGLLDRRRATTHWLYAEQLAREHPQVVVASDELYVDHGDVATSAGSAAGLDLCLHLVRNDLGAEVADEVARRIVLPVHRAGDQRQWLRRPVPLPVDDFTAAVDWMLAHLDQPMSLPLVAARFHMTERTLHRRFRESLGASPRQWLIHQRVLEACRLLESTDLSVETIARRSGLGSALNLRLRFRDRLGTTPGRYRESLGQPRRSSRGPTHAPGAPPPPQLAE